MVNLSDTKYKSVKYLLFAVPGMIILFLSALLATQGFGGEAPPQTVTFSSIAILKNLARENKYFTINVPYDMAGNTAEMKDFLAEIAKSAKTQGAKSTQLWLVGDAMSDFISEAKSRGITVKKNALLLPHFAPGDTAKKSE